MPYSNFTYKKVRLELGIMNERKRIFPELKPEQPSKWLEETLSVGADLALFSEKARSEAIVFPNGNF